MITTIVSGAQTGADRAALDVALAWGLECGGWVPLGRMAEDGVIPGHYPNLRETETAETAVRTERNVRDSDGTLILSHGGLSGGSLHTQQLAHRLGRPTLHIDLERTDGAGAVATAAAWLQESGIGVLNVAGPRASRDPDIYAATLIVLSGVLGRVGAALSRSTVQAPTP